MEEVIAKIKRMNGIDARGLLIEYLEWLSCENEILKNSCGGESSYSDTIVIGKQYFAEECLEELKELVNNV